LKEDIQKKQQKYKFKEKSKMKKKVNLFYANRNRPFVLFQRTTTNDREEIIKNKYEKT
jgi:hypothetical protein